MYVSIGGKTAVLELAELTERWVLLSDASAATAGRGVSSRVRARLEEWCNEGDKLKSSSAPRFLDWLKNCVINPAMLEPIYLWWCGAVSGGLEGAVVVVLWLSLCFFSK